MNDIPFMPCPVSTTTTTTERPLPPWMRRRTTTTPPPTTSTTTTEATTTRRVPITLPPTRERTTKARRTGEGDAGSSKLGKGVGRKAANESTHIVNRFLSSSISSTNIMDTSEVPVTLVGEEDSKDASSTTTT